MPSPLAARLALCIAVLLAAPAGVGAATEPTASATAITAQDLLRRGAPAQALALVRQSLQRNPADAPLRFLEGVALMDLGRDAEALALFTEFSQRWPELPDPLNNIALLHARAGRMDEALAALLAALRADPAHRAARLNLAEMHLLLAARAFEQAAAIAPLEPPLAARLQAVRSLLAGTAR
jgi:Flp pilus assembly protein TadD